MRSITAAVLIAAMPWAVHADPGTYLAGACANCHGTDGRSDAGGMASLAGRPASELMEKLRDFRTGKVTSTVMGQLVPGFSEEQLHMLADHFSRQDGSRP